MENIFVDVNVLMDILGDREFGFEKVLDKKTITVSALSFHILMYIMRLKVPNSKLNKYRKSCLIVALNKKIIKDAMIGPTDDFEDNVQLHSAVVGECDYFLTLDKKLLRMKYFGKMRISDKL
jgi:predicted nucleic acid-binding protein